MDKQELIDFEEDIKKDFLAGKIRHPVHFSKGNEDQIIEVFKQIKEDDWVFCTHRNHFAALLKGIPGKWIKEQIYHGNSMHLMSDKYKFFASAIVCGSVPIAVGVAMAIKRKGGSEKVWCFVGDMASTTGIFSECVAYANVFHLPIIFIVEDNNLSTNTPTDQTWNGFKANYWGNMKVIYYKYERQCPHINVDSFVEFK